MRGRRVGDENCVAGVDDPSSEYGDPVPDPDEIDGGIERERYTSAVGFDGQQPPCRRGTASRAASSLACWPSAPSGIVFPGASKL